MSSDDLDRLARELDGSRRATPEADVRLDGWLRVVAERRASDLLLLAGEPPALRIQGQITRTEGPVLDGLDIEDMVITVLPPEAVASYRAGGSADASRRLPGLGRFRINLHRERGRAAANIRMVPVRVPSLASLDLPPGIGAGLANASRARHHRRRDRIGEDDDDGRDRRRDQSARREARDHDRGSDRVRARQPERCGPANRDRA